MSSLQINRFLFAFGKDVQLCYNSQNDRISSMVKCDVTTAIKQNADGRDVYFYINGGGTKQADINQLRACFVDLDAGRGPNGKYLLTRQVDSKKKLMLSKIRSFPLKASYVVETRNGYQVYWLLDGNHRAKDYAKTWNVIQNKIDNYFKSVGSDSLTKKINQIYRVPYLMWRKKWEGKEPFYVKIIINNNRTRYSLSHIAKALLGTSAIISKVRGDSGPKAYAKKKPAGGKMMIFPKSNHKVNRGVFTGSIQHSPKCPPRSIDSFRKNLTENYKQHEYSEATENDLSIKETIEFLLEVKQILWYCKKQFMSNSAERLANELSARFCV